MTEDSSTVPALPAHINQMFTTDGWTQRAATVFVKVVETGASPVAWVVDVAGIHATTHQAKAFEAARILIDDMVELIGQTRVAPSTPRFRLEDAGAGQEVEWAMLSQAINLWRSGSTVILDH